MSDVPRREPSADIRQAASAMRQIYVALVQEGFTNREALAILGAMLANQRGDQR